MSRIFRPALGTPLKLVTALAGIAVAGWAIADTAGIATFRPSELPSSFVLAAAPGGSDGSSPLPRPPRPEGPAMRNAGPGGPDNARPPHPAGPPPLPGPARLAQLLAAAEIYIGVRADQIDTWRTFTDAAIALVPEPPPSPTAGRTAEPFARPSEMASRLVAEGKKAEQLLAAIEQLKVKLTPAQLQRVAQFEALLPPPPPPPGAVREPGPPPRAPGAPGAPPMPN